MRIRCIDNNNLYIKNLTFYKIYEVKENLKNQYKIIDDNNELNVFGKSLFEIIEK